MEEARGSSPRSSTDDTAAAQLSPAFLGGFIAGEGSFVVSRRRFGFYVRVAARDAPVLEALKSALGIGSISYAEPRDPRWQPQAAFAATGRRQNIEVTVPFMERWLPSHTHKYSQYVVWRDALIADVASRPFRVAATSSSLCGAYETSSR